MKEMLKGGGMGSGLPDAGEPGEEE
jgi:hypothetical protein